MQSFNELSFSKKDIFLLILIGIFILGCEGPTGEKGKDASETCYNCHNSTTTIVAKKNQWTASKHKTGTAFEQNDTACAPCHTSEGFRETILNGTFATKSKIQNPTGQSCRTCHFVHSNYNLTDFNLTYQAPVKLLVNDVTVDFGRANLCARCHQARVVKPMPVLDGDSILITNPYWGPHQNPAANILAGSGGIEIPGSEPYQNSTHIKPVNEDGCITCHMNTAFGNQSGGHTWIMTFMYRGTKTQNMAGCISCHPGSKDFSLGLGIQAEISGYMTELRNILSSKRCIDTSQSFGKFTSDIVIPKKYSAKEASVIFNYLLCAAERSKGIHNTKYSRALLKNSLAAIKQ